MIFGLKLHKRLHFLAMQGSLVIRGFKIRGPLTERIYRELQGPAACTGFLRLVG